MKCNNIIAVVAVGFILTGCGIYNKYEQNTPTPADAFGTDASIQSASSETTIAEMSWRDFFTDPLLQQLIDQVLANNTDLNSARIAVEKSQAALTAAKLAYLPSLAFAPQGTLSSFDNSKAVKTYNLPLQLSMDLDVFGSITNKKRAAKAALMQTDSLWDESLETEKALWENGKAYSTAVNQMEASYLSVKTQIVDTRRNIRSVENAICKLLAVSPRHIERAKWGSSILHYAEEVGDAEEHSFSTKYLRIGVPAQMLENRPDIRMANHAMEEAFYNTAAARSAFYPTITLSGAAGWTNNSGMGIVDPGKLLLNAVAQLTQPIFARGKLIANKKIAKLTEEDMQQKYVQMVINAGNEVNEAMADYMTARDKHDFFQRQVQVLREAYTGTHELMDNGKASYIEVLRAQESLLDAQLSSAMNMYYGAESIIALYIALGGGSN